MSQAASAAPAPRPRRRVSRRGWVTIGCLAAALTAGVGYAGIRAAGGFTKAAVRAAGGVMGMAQPTNVGPVVRVAAQEPISILVMSNENAPQDAGPQLTDSMMVMSFDPQAQTAAVLSIPRDLWVDIPGYGQQRINVAFEDGGAPTAELTVEKYIGVPIEYYAIVDYKAFTSLVDAVGGIDVNVPYKIYDPQYPNVEENRNTLFELSAGPHHLDGATALKFARERHAFIDGDIQRERDQQLALFALKDALLKPQNLLKLPAIIGDMKQLVTTNIPYNDLPQVADQVLHVQRSAIRTGVLDSANGAVFDSRTSAGADVLGFHPDAVRRVVAGTFPTLLADMDAMTVQVENGAPTRQPLATYFSGVLQGMGVQTLTPEQAARTNYAVSHVYVNTAVVHLGRRAPLPTEAVILGQMLGVQVETQPRPESQAQIVVLLGKAFPTI